MFRKLSLATAAAAATLTMVPAAAEASHRDGYYDSGRYQQSYRGDRYGRYDSRYYGRQQRPLQRPPLQGHDRHDRRRSRRRPARPRGDPRPLSRPHAAPPARSSAAPSAPSPAARSTSQQLPLRLELPRVAYRGRGRSPDGGRPFFSGSEPDRRNVRFCPGIGMTSRRVEQAGELLDHRAAELLGVHDRHRAARNSG